MRLVKDSKRKCCACIVSSQKAAQQLGPRYLAGETAKPRVKLVQSSTASAWAMPGTLVGFRKAFCRAGALQARPKQALMND